MQARERLVSPEQFTCHQSDLAGRLGLITVTGEIDPTTAPIMKTELLTAITRRSAHLVIDLTGVTFMDSTGLATLLAARRRAQAEDGDVQLVGPSRIVRKVLAISHMDRVFPIYDSLDELLADVENTPEAAGPGVPKPRSDAT